MKKLVLFLTLAIPYIASATTYYVSPTGNSTTATSKDAPGSLTVMVKKLAAGDVLYLLDGQYDLTSTLSINNSGNEDNYITICAADGATPILDFRQQANGNNMNGVKVSGDYLYIKGLTIRYAGYKGIWLEKAKYCVLEHLDVYGCCNSGIQLRSGGHNTVVNCDSHDNFDYQDKGGNADGFADKQGEACPGNVYIGCRAWNNSDDGWDSYQRVTSGTPTVYINCITYNNGPASYNLSEHPRVVGVDAGLDCFKGKDLKHFPNGGNPNGFKLGGKSTKHNAELYRCLAVGHRGKGFDQNSNAGNMLIVNCTSYKNNRNYGFYNNNGYHLTIYNSISLSGEQADDFQSAVTTESHNTWSKGFSVSENDFESLDVKGMILSPRQADGTLPNTLLLHLKATATNLIDKGMECGSDMFEGDKIGDHLTYNGTCPDLGCYEYDSSATGFLNIETDKELYNAHALSYDLQGHKIGDSYKGIFIQSGRKFLR